MNGFGRTYEQARFEDHFPVGDSDPTWDDEIAEVLVDEDRHNGPPMEDSVQLYLREIGQVALLNAVDEYALAQEITRGQDALLSLQRQHYRTRGERLALERAVARGEESRRQLIQANLRLVVSIAKK